MLCVVEQEKDLLAIENSALFRGVYHVLQGNILPREGEKSASPALQALLKRLSKEPFQEIILALNATVEGEATASYLLHLLAPYHLKITHLAQGIPMGGNLEFLDAETLKHALLERRQFS
jgi:recombination protein RecR